MSTGWADKLKAACQREGMVVRESNAESTAQAVANELAKAPSCRRIVF
jgi:hypothetical protein